MSDTPVIRTALGGFPGYELLDSGHRRKLERVGAVTIIPRGDEHPVFAFARHQAGTEDAGAGQ